MAKNLDELERDIDRVQSIPEIPLMLDVCSRATGMRFVGVARVTDDRWITCASLDNLSFGLNPGDELVVETTICHEVRACRHVVVIDNVDDSEVYRDHHTPRQYGFKSYISMPIIRTDGSFFGTLCAIDPAPRSLDNEHTLGMFSLFAQLIAVRLDTQEQYETSQDSLIEERQTSMLREQFIAVVGHDLRNPVAAMSAGLRMLEREVSGDRASMLLVELQKTAARMGMIVENLLDFARGRLGDGIDVDRSQHIALNEVLESIVGEVQAISKQPIEFRSSLNQPVALDQLRIGQLFSNILNNAVTHGAPDQPVSIDAVDDGEAIMLTVTNKGDPIPPEVQKSLFLPFARGGDGLHRQGLGLGLYIASEIAKAHGGEIELFSDPEHTRFTVRIPKE